LSACKFEDLDLLAQEDQAAVTGGLGRQQFDAREGGRRGKCG